MLITTAIGKAFLVRLILVLFISFMSSNSVSAGNYYPNYLNGDNNWVMVNGKQGMAWYIDKSSVSVQKYAPPEYRIAINVATVYYSSNGYDLDLVNSPKIEKIETHYYYYNWNDRKMYHLDPITNELSYMPPIGDYASTSHVIEGELTFYAAYRMKFYGGRQWFNSKYNSYETAVPNEFYALMDAK